ncbi:excinuclease Cho [Paucimonas lemoignei]|uniref:Excinuclease cho n=1 Tax=Paucimonas lemoignei TaxID=29443 RepID=A0A4R3HUT1_PAULE|nr:endonuclease [Paucimonas lemoignei]TCS36243.1 excinuclease Cho [Paucimonas lemoignei]
MRPRVTSVGLLMPRRPAEEFIAPSHIDQESVAALPPKPGVYFFRNRYGKPVYIGKSVNLRSRVLAHLRTPEEALMLAETRHIDFIRTAGELGALLLESQLIKQYQPRFNVLLKFCGESFGLAMTNDASCPQVMGYGETDMLDAPMTMHGLFASRGEALQGWQRLVRQYRLCPALLKIEATINGRACFSHQLGQCRGACIGLESPEAHWQRLRSALEQLNATVWPYAGPIAIIETDGKWRQAHLIDRWTYVGSLEGRRRNFVLPPHPGIDIDTYKILSRPLAEDSVPYVTCETKSSRDGTRTCVLPPQTSVARLATLS